MNQIVRGMNSSKAPLIYVITIRTVSNAAGGRIASLLTSMVDALLGFCNLETETPTAEDMQLLEQSLRAIKSIITRCSGIERKQFHSIMTAGISLLSFDPFYVADTEDVEEYFDDYDEGEVVDPSWETGEYKADDANTASSDDAWKVRRQATTLLSTLGVVNSNLLKENFNELCAAALNQFGDRDSNVKSEVFNTISVFVKEANQDHDPATSTGAMPGLVRQKSLALLVLPQIPAIVSSAGQYFVSGTEDVKVAIMSLLAQVVQLCHSDVQQEVLAQTFPDFLPHVVAGVVSASVDSFVLAEESLKCLNALSSIVAAPYFTDYSYSLMEALGTCIAAGGPVVSSGLEVLELFVQRIVPDTGDDNATWMADCVIPIFEQKDVDEAIKLAAISCMSTLFSVYGSLGSRFSAALPVYVDRMSNLSTANACVKGIARMAISESKLDLSSLVSGHMKTFCSYLRKSTPQLPVNSCVCISNLVTRHASSLSSGDLKACVTEAAHHMDAKDLRLAEEVLNLVVVLLKNCKRASSQVASSVLGPAFALAGSPYVSGNAVTALANFFHACVVSNARESTMSFNKLRANLVARVEKKRGSNYTPIAKCIAKMITATDAKTAKTAVSSIVGDLKKRDPHNVQVALYIIGELGSLQNLDQYVTGTSAKVIAAFDDKNVDVQLAAAYAYGIIVAGNLDSISDLLNLLSQTNRKLRTPGYLALCVASLKSALTLIGKDAQASEAFAPYITSTSAKLFVYPGHADDAVRGYVGECLGRLMVLDSKENEVCRQVCALAQNGRDLERMVAVTAVRMSFREGMNYDYLMLEFPALISILSGSSVSLDLKVNFVDTIAALVVANSSAINRDLMQNKILPELYKEAKIYPSRVKVVDYGGFKVNKDSGLPLRRAVLKCLITVKDYLPRYVNFGAFLSTIGVGVNDPALEILAITVDIITSLSRSHKAVVLEFLSGLGRLVLGTLKKQKKNMSLTNFKEKALVKAAKEWGLTFITGVVTWNKIPEVAKNPGFQQLVNAIVKQKALNPIWKSVSADLDSG